MRKRIRFSLAVVAPIVAVALLLLGLSGCDVINPPPEEEVTVLSVKQIHELAALATDGNVWLVFDNGTVTRKVRLSQLFHNVDLDLGTGDIAATDAAITGSLAVSGTALLDDGVQINETNPASGAGAAMVDIDSTFTTGTGAGLHVDLDHTPASGGSWPLSIVSDLDVHGDTGPVTGIRSDVNMADGAAITPTYVSGIQNYIDIEDATTASAIGVESPIPSVDTGTVTNGYGVKVADASVGAGELTNAYGVHIGTIDSGTSANYAVYAAGGNSFFGGSVTVTEQLRVGGGTVGSPAEIHIYPERDDDGGPTVGVFSRMESEDAVYTRAGQFVAYARESSSQKSEITGILAEGATLTNGNVDESYGARMYGGSSTGGGPVNTAYGAYGTVWNLASSTVTNAVGTQGYIWNNSTGEITNGYAVRADVANVWGSGTISEARGLSLDNWLNAGTVNASYGIYMDDTIDMGAGTAYAIYIGEDSPNFFKGIVDTDADSMRIRTSQTPPTSTAECEQGEYTWDSDYWYVCVSDDTWKRAALTSW